MSDLVDRASEKVVRGVAKNAPAQDKAHGESGDEESTKPPLEELPAKDRKALRGIIGHRLEKE